MHADPGLVVDVKRFEGAKASAYVASYTNDSSCLKGKTVTPSGRRSSPRSRPTGSKTEWKPAASNVGFVMSLMAACRRNLPAQCRRDNGYRPSGRP